MCYGDRRPTQIWPRPIDPSLLKQQVQIKQEEIELNHRDDEEEQQQQHLSLKEKKNNNSKKNKHNHHYPSIIVQHDYHDHSHDNRAIYEQEQHPARGM